MKFRTHSPEHLQQIIDELIRIGYSHLKRLLIVRKRVHSFFYVLDNAVNFDDCELTFNFSSQEELTLDRLKKIKSKTDHH